VSAASLCGRRGRRWPAYLPTPEPSTGSTSLPALGCTRCTI
jgi:hypothetical protein